MKSVRMSDSQGVEGLRVNVLWVVVRRLSPGRCGACSSQDRIHRTWREKPADFVPPRTHCYDLETFIEPPEDMTSLGEIQHLLLRATLSPWPPTEGVRLHHTSLRAPEY